MKICIPIENDQGLESRARAHVGGAPFFAVVDVESDHVDILRNTHRRHGRGESGPGAHIRELGVQAVVCSDIGRRAFSSLEEAGIEVLVTEKTTVGEILAEAHEGRLRLLSADEISRTRGRGHGWHR
jgi:predicted Fe-Mo cluster-binding NifX family protein